MTKTPTYHYYSLPPLSLHFNVIAPTEVHLTIIQILIKPTQFNLEYRNLTPKQRHKLQLHEHCNHAHWEQIND
jgi:hypothetical protein